MERSLILETTFLIDLDRELARGEVGPAQELLARVENSRLFLTFTVAGELAAGPQMQDRKRWEEFIAPFHSLPCTADVCWEYGRAYRYFCDNGLLIGANDLWIAATAVAYRIPLVTRNVKHFRRVPGLDLFDY